jgi:DNA-binding beta-propeller fold protein YncE
VRLDYQSIDTTSNRLYISHMNAGELIVFDLNARKVEGTVSDLPRITGVWSVPALGKVYASVPGHHHVAVIDARTLRVEARVGRIGFPDGIAYAPDARKVYVSDESGGGELVIDGTTDSVVTTIPLGGEAGNTVYDPGSGHILVAVQTRNEVTAIDPRTDRVISRHPLPGASHPHGMSVDAGGRLLFVANEGNATLLVVDLKTMRVIGHLAVGEDPDVLAFDPLWGRLYVAAESGEVTVFAVRDGHLAREGRFTMPDAHTVSVDPRTHLVYFPLKDVEGHPLLRIMTARHP